MERNYHFIKQRLDNIKSIKPLLMSLRTISLSNWKMALKKLEHLNTYMQSMDGMLNNILQKDQQSSNPSFNNNNVMLVLGSSRGLCGGYNRDLLYSYQTFRNENPDLEIKSYLFGEKMKKLFVKNNLLFEKVYSYPKISSMNFVFVTSLLAQLTQPNSFPTIYLAYNTYMGSGKYKPAIQKVNMADLSVIAVDDLPHNNFLIDTDFNELVAHIQKHDFLIAIYRAFISAFASEHSTRFQIMENSISNTDKLVQELTIMVQVERQKKVTSEMRELSISAGLLNKT